MVLGSGIRDPRSGIRKKPIPDPGSRGQKSTGPGSRIRIRNTGSRYRYHFLSLLYVIMKKIYNRADMEKRRYGRQRCFESGLDPDLIWPVDPDRESGFKKAD
jgi:hypothetical protein